MLRERLATVSKEQEEEGATVRVRDQCFSPSGFVSLQKQRKDSLKTKFHRDSNISTVDL